MFTLAHISDVHLSPLPKPALRALAGKRLTGYLYWLHRRRAIHRREVLDRLIADMHAQQPDHVAVVGDLVNLSLPEEFLAARHWLQSLGPPEKISVVPGNHDAYVRLGINPGIEHWHAYMNSNSEGAAYVSPDVPIFPFVRRLGSIALIGLSTAVPRRPFVASGFLGELQQRAAGMILKKLGEEGVYRIVLIHHSPLVDKSSRRRGLEDAGSFSELLCTCGAELVIHGHNHQSSLRYLKCGTGSIAICGVPSASSSGLHREAPAAYNLYRIARSGQGWQCEVVTRGFGSGESSVRELARTACVACSPVVGGDGD